MTDTKPLSSREEFQRDCGQAWMWIIRGVLAFDALGVMRNAWEGSLSGVLIILAIALPETYVLVRVQRRVRAFRGRTRQLEIEALEKDLGMR